MTGHPPPLATALATLALLLSGAASAQQGFVRLPASEQARPSVVPPPRSVAPASEPARPPEARPSEGSTVAPAPASEAARPPGDVPSAAAPPTGEARPRVRSSHTVDVVAPGEKVDTIFGRMGVDRPTPPPRGDGVRPPPGENRGPPQGPGRGGPPQGGDGRGGGRPHSPRTDGSRPPPSSSQPPPPSPTR